MKDWSLERSLTTLHASTALDVLADRVLVYALGDDGYGVVYFKDQFRQYERATKTQLKDGQKPIAKTALLCNFRKDAFVMKTGGYTTAHDNRRV